jgi:hypothetical protein
MANSKDPPPSRPNTPGLGLPYEVQHYILSMMQRIIEEGTYAFATRWIPDTLEKHRWTCSEAVELSTWKSVLPSAVPRNALINVANLSLDEALLDAVKIRNAAAHRHLCDNVELKQMALTGQSLMTMYSDMTRQSKFDLLWSELNDWDTTNEENMDATQVKLQHALQEISERPLDDMDWTPNAVSLQELSSADTISANGTGMPVEEVDQYFSDEMQLD